MNFLQIAKRTCFTFCDARGKRLAHAYRHVPAAPALGSCKFESACQTVTFMMSTARRERENPLCERLPSRSGLARVRRKRRILVCGENATRQERKQKVPRARPQRKKRDGEGNCRNKSKYPKSRQGYYRDNVFCCFALFFLLEEFGFSAELQRSRSL